MSNLHFQPNPISGDATWPDAKQIYQPKLDYFPVTAQHCSYTTAIDARTFIFIYFNEHHIMLFNHLSLFHIKEHLQHNFLLSFTLYSAHLFSQQLLFSLLRS